MNSKKTETIQKCTLINVQRKPSKDKAQNKTAKISAVGTNTSGTLRPQEKMELQVYNDRKAKSN